MKKTQAVTVAYDVYMDWSGHPPRYRTWVDDQLFLERTFTWQHCYVEDRLVILVQALKTAGQQTQHNIHVDLMDRDQARLTVVNWRVIDGPGVVDQQGQLYIQNG